MKNFIPLLVLSLAACSGGEPIPGAIEATLQCEMFCDACVPDGTRCAEDCLTEWHTFGGFEDQARRDCAASYLIARECQFENAPSCDTPACGDPYADMIRCVELIGSGVDNIPVE